MYVGFLLLLPNLTCFDTRSKGFNSLLYLRRYYTETGACGENTPTPGRDVDNWTWSGWTYDSSLQILKKDWLGMGYIKEE